MGQSDAIREKTKVYFPNLDGLRFICFLSVFFRHSFSTQSETIKNAPLYAFVKGFLAENGDLGVNFFFVLSGFLITYLLMVEKEKFGNIQIPNFYVRRVLRIWPLYYCAVIFGFFIFPMLKSLAGEMPNESASFVFYLFFMSNLDIIRQGLPDSSILGVLWSVAIEEQFYLFWPLLLYFLPVRFYLRGLMTIIVLTFFFRLLNAEHSIILEFHTLSCISDMTVGGIFAILSYKSLTFKNSIGSLPQWCWLLLYAIVACIYLYRKQIFNHGDFLIALDRLIISILFGLIIVEQNFARNSFYKMSALKLISRLGIYTYGLYCLHMVGILIAARLLAYLGLNKNVYQVIFLEGTLSLLITGALAFLSYHQFEKRFLFIKLRFARISKY